MPQPNWFLTNIHIHIHTRINFRLYNAYKFDEKILKLWNTCITFNKQFAKGPLICFNKYRPSVRICSRANERFT